jgi:uncharacterized protein
MASYFLDSSAIVKHYVEEAGSRWIAQLMDPRVNHAIHASVLTEVEVVAALTRRLASAGAAAQVIDRVVTLFRSNFESDTRVLEINPQLLDQAIRLARKYAVRGYDAVQLAAALQSQTECRNQGLELTLVSADEELNAAALAEGLRVENPNQQL